MRPVSLTPLILLALALPAAAQLKLPAVIGDHMVLQHGDAARIWGWGEPDTAVVVTPSWTSASTTVQVAADGRWSVSIAATEAGGPHTISIESGQESIALSDVLIGEVWVCSGQSNMEWNLHNTNEGAELIASASHPRIHFFDVPHVVTTSKQVDCVGQWRVCDPTTVGGFSAIGYLFGRELLQALDMPVGLIGSNWGGTRAEAWTSEAALRAAFPEFDDELDEMAELRANPNAGSDLNDRRQAWWKGVEDKDPGMKGRWMEAGFDDSAWATATLPGVWKDLGLEGFDGCLWYRATVDLPASWSGQELVLELGPIDDMDLTYFNGVLVGESRGGGSWTTPRAYAIPAGSVQTGTNTIAVCAVDTGGVGRMGSEPEGMRLVQKSGGEKLALAGEWRWSRGVALGELGGFPNTGWMNQHRPSVLSKGMLEPILPYTIRGAIWYQGESNRGRAVQYRSLFPAMITDWRDRWGIGDFPFLFVQLAPFGYGGDKGQLSELREAQTMALDLPNTGMAVTMDIGNPDDIHPRNKQDVGHRLALWALAKTYGQDVGEYSGPLYAGVKVEGGKLRVSLTHAKGLTSGDSPPSHFTIAGEDQTFHPAQATIDGETVVVWSEAVSAPVAVRYAWGARDEPNLKNGAGLPAPSFRTDDWPPVSAAR